LREAVNEFAAVVENRSVQDDKVDVEFDSAAGLGSAQVLVGGRWRRSLNLDLGGGGRGEEERDRKHKKEEQISHIARNEKS